MRVSERQKTKRDTLSIRVEPEVKRLIDRAAKLAGKTRADFVLNAARQIAEDTTWDCTVIAVNPKAYTDFLARLDASPQPNERLRRALQRSASWD